MFLAKLALVEGEFLLTVSEEYFNIPAFCVDIENFLCGKLCMSRYKHPKCLGFSKGFFRITQQDNRVFMAIHFALIPQPKISILISCFSTLISPLQLTLQYHIDNSSVCYLYIFTRF